MSTVEHRQGVLYQHASRPEWGPALFLGEAEGKLRFRFVDGEERSFTARLGHLLTPCPEHAAAGSSPRRRTRRVPPSRRSSSWTSAADAKLRELSEVGATDAEIAEALGVTRDAAKARRRRLGLAGQRTWTEADELELRRLSGEGATDELLAQALGRSLNAVRVRKRKLGLATRAPRWSAADDELLRSDLSNAEVARRLGRTAAAVSNRRYRLGVGKHVCRPWTPEEDETLRSDRPGAELAAELGRTVEAVKKRRRDLRRAG